MRGRRRNWGVGSGGSGGSGLINREGGHDGDSMALRNLIDG